MLLLVPEVDFPLGDLTEVTTITMTGDILMDVDLVGGHF